MNPRELYKAVAAQCVWCREQWGITFQGKHYVHVGPFTKDPHLFSRTCEADQIRIAFNYADYNGGKQIKHKPRLAKELYKIITSRQKGNGGFCRRVDSPEHRSFWRTGTLATLEVASWPEWKQSCGIDGKRSEPVTEERLVECRRELLFYDECDFACRQPCTENLQYRPKLDRNWSEPTCNDGMGCTTCWERHEAAVVKWENENPCPY